MLEIISFTLGPLANNSYLIADDQSGIAVAIDPSFEPQPILDHARRKNWSIQAIWLTHAHFDHIAGVTELVQTLQPAPQVALHPADLPLWRESGGARMFGFNFTAGAEPTLALAHGQQLWLGEQPLEVRHTPGHSPGHCVFWSAAVQTVLCGDLIFRRSVGRTDLPGASSAQLAHSIRSQIYVLPPTTRLLSGHGPETTVGEEVSDNPYV